MTARVDDSRALKPEAILQQRARDDAAPGLYAEEAWSRFDEDAGAHTWTRSNTNTNGTAV